ncbi:hypothetical protein [uncultured Brachyspira sp.]|uniref:hypothetical protein n=1 Tax=uncultured Brachyspira sp. TaxID=221953 RepID=UPI0025D23127|nr:hypothetical protein [uncultured Brachyspira sp.]
MKRYFIMLLLMSCSFAYAFDEGFIWALKANFNGTATTPIIGEEDLAKLGAAYMKGGVGYTMDGEAELGYLFGSERWFGMDPSKFSGMSVFGSIGVGSGGAYQVSGNTIKGVTATVYMNISYAPVISFGVGTKAYFLNSRLALGLHIGGKLIADLSPEYLYYSDDPTIFPPTIGEIIVTDFMIKNMNPFTFSVKFMLEYNQPVNDRVEVILGAYMRYNVFKPKYITMPEQLLGAAGEIGPDGVPQGFDPTTALPSYYLNSVDFGLTIGLAFKG